MELGRYNSLEDAAKGCAGNHRRFNSFAWHDAPDDDDKWTIVYTHNRDSGTLDRANAEAIAARLEPFTKGDDPDVVAEHHGHWACGWVDGFAVRVYASDGSITPAFEE